MEPHYIPDIDLSANTDSRADAHDFSYNADDDVTSESILTHRRSARFTDQKNLIRPLKVIKKDTSKAFSEMNTLFDLEKKSQLFEDGKESNNSCEINGLVTEQLRDLDNKPELVEIYWSNDENSTSNKYEATSVISDEVSQHETSRENSRAEIDFNENENDKSFHATQSSTPTSIKRSTSQSKSTPRRRRRSLSTGSQSSYENTAAFQTLVSTFTNNGEGSGAVVSPSRGRQNSVSGTNRSAFSTISVNRLQDYASRNSSTEFENRKLSVSSFHTMMGSKSSTPKSLRVQESHFEMLENERSLKDSEIGANILQDKIFSSSSPSTPSSHDDGPFDFDEAHDHYPPYLFKAPPPTPSSNFTDTPSQIRMRRIRPGAAGTIGPRNFDNRIKPDMKSLRLREHEPIFSSVSTKQQNHDYRKHLRNDFRRSSFFWRQQMVDESLNLICRRITSMYERTASNKNHGIFSEPRKWVIENFDVLLGVGCTVLGVGVIFITVCSWIDDFDQDIIGFRTTIDECVSVSDSYSSTLSCLTGLNLPSFVKHSGFGLDNRYIHKLVLLDLYSWGLVFAFIGLPTFLSALCFSILSIGGIILLCLMACEQILRCTLSTTRKLMSHQVEIVDNISNLAEGIDPVIDHPGMLE
ncbi:hypothetical protein V1511DRAFT_493931 [Dipodascopsis uninucleata]